MIALKKDLHFRKKQSNLEMFLKQRATQKSNYRTIQDSIYVYDQNHLIGDGYTSRVYKGYETQNLKQQYAVKIIDLRRISQDHIKLIENQIQIHPTLNHKNIVKCYDVVRTQRWIYIILQLCPDGNLDDYIRQKNKVSQVTAIKIIEQINQGYRYLIQQGILHRDIKPANIFKKGTTWKISDFGFSVKGKKSLIDHMNVGTPLYMPPEALQESFYSHKSDIFAIGCILYQLIEGRTPWYSKNQKQLSTIMLKTEPKTQKILNQKVKQFILKCLDVKQGKRMSVDQFNQFTFGKPQLCLQIKISQIKEANNNYRSMIKTPLSSRSTNWQKQGITSRTMKSMNSQSTLQTSFYFKNSTCQIKDNTQNLQKQFEFCHLLKNLAINCQKSVLLQDNQKQIFTVLLCKHCIYLLKKIGIASNRPKNVDLNQWQTYKKTEQYLNFKAQLKDFQENIQKWFNNYLKSVSLKIVSEVNKKFPELNYHSQLSKKFFENLRDYLRTVLRQISLQINKIIKSEFLLTSPYINSHYFYAFKSIHQYYTTNEEKIIKHIQSAKNLLNESKCSISNKTENQSFGSFKKASRIENSSELFFHPGSNQKKMTFPSYNKTNQTYKNPVMFNSKLQQKRQKKEKPFDCLQNFQQSKMSKQSFLQLKKQLKWLI